MPKYQFIYLQPAGDNLFPHTEAEIVAQPYAEVLTGTLEASCVLDAAEKLFVLHNRDDRPRGHDIMSMSVGCVLILGEVGKVSWSPDKGWEVLWCAPVGWERITSYIPIPDERVLGIGRTTGAAYDWFPVSEEVENADTV